MVGDQPECKDILEYISKVEDMRHCEDPAAAAALATANQFTLDHVPGHLLTSQTVSPYLKRLTFSKNIFNLC